MSIYDALDLKSGDSVDYFGKRCTVMSVDKQSGLVEIKEPGSNQGYHSKGFVSYVWPKSLRKVRGSNA